MAGMSFMSTRFVISLLNISYYHQLRRSVITVQSFNDAQLKQLSKLSEIVHCGETHSDKAAGTIKITDLPSRNSPSLKEHKHKQREHKQYLTHFALEELAFLIKLHPICKRHQNIENIKTT